MVLIEHDETEEKNHANTSKPSVSTESKTVHSNDSATNVNRDASDGFETASDGELGDSGDEKGEQGHENLQKVHEDEMKQKALDQANDTKSEGNKLFGEGKYEEALLEYELTLQVAPDIPSSVELRSICHSNRGICFLKLGKYGDTVKECSKALELNPTYMKALLRRGEAHEKLEQFEEAISDMKKILELDSSNDHARKSIRRLEPLAEQKRENMKEEMIGKLKDMGNSLLGRFGMSVDNFKAVKDLKTGSYSISFQQ